MKPDVDGHSFSENTKGIFWAVIAIDNVDNEASRDRFIAELVLKIKDLFRASGSSPTLEVIQKFSEDGLRVLQDRLGADVRCLDQAGAFILLNVCQYRRRMRKSYTIYTKKSKKN